MKQRDFTVSYYRNLLITLQKSGYSIVTVEQYLKGDFIQEGSKVAILRHDIDRRLYKACLFADIEALYGINATYYFRYTAFDFPEIVRYVSDKGHEIGYHYETISRASGDILLAFEYFKKDLKKLRSMTPVSTVCMHGAPLSQHNNLLFWNHYKLNDFTLIGEAFISISNVQYFSDTGRTWSMNHKMRDSLSGGLIREDSDNINGTEDLINYIVQKKPPKLYILTHPERWSGSFCEWIMMYGVDTSVNIGKQILSFIRR